MPDENYNFWAINEINGAKYQRVKISIGESGIAEDLSAANPMPVELPLSGSEVSDIRNKTILKDILNQAKITNMYLSKLVNEEFTIIDIREDL